MLHDRRCYLLSQNACAEDPTPVIDLGATATGRKGSCGCKINSFKFSFILYSFMVDSLFLKVFLRVFWFCRCVTEKEHKKRRACVKSQKNCCYLCGHFTLRMQLTSVTNRVKQVYCIYFGCCVGDKDKWATCVLHYVTYMFDKLDDRGEECYAVGHCSGIL